MYARICALILVIALVVIAAAAAVPQGVAAAQDQTSTPIPTREDCPGVPIDKNCPPWSTTPPPVGYPPPVKVTATPPGYPAPDPWGTPATYTPPDGIFGSPPAPDQALQDQTRAGELVQFTRVTAGRIRSYMIQVYFIIRGWLSTPQ